MHTFGESHGLGLGTIIDGLPSGLIFRNDFLVQDLFRRRPGAWSLPTSYGVSERKEPDIPEVLSGVYLGKTLGTPLCVFIRNQDQDSSAYINQPDRLGHADDVWRNKFTHVDPRGGGRSSGRETVSRVIGGSIGRMLLNQLSPQTQVKAFSYQIGPYQLQQEEEQETKDLDIDDFIGRFPSHRFPQLKDELIELQKTGDSWGGSVEVKIFNPPALLGQPVFHKIKNDIASACLSLGASYGIDFIFNNDTLLGTEFHNNSHSYSGIRGGITTGEEITFRVKFKPTSSIKDISKKGRHDPCIIIRAVPVVEAMVNFVLADHLLWRKLDTLDLLKNSQ